MSEPTLAAPAAADTPVVTEETTNGGNPAWEPALSKVPKEFHPLLTPVFSEWDQGVQKKIGEVHSKYEPWKAFVDNSVDPTEAQSALGVYRMLNNPDEARKIYDAMAEHYGYNTTEQGQSAEGTVEEEVDPRIAELEKQIAGLTGHFTQQQQNEQNAQMEKQLDSELASAKEKHGDWNTIDGADRVILGFMASGMSADEAVQQLYKIVPKPAAPQPNLPHVIGGGGTPSGQIPVPKTEKDRRALVVEKLKAMHEAG